MWFDCYFGGAAPAAGPFETGWSWTEFEALPHTVWQGDIHCVTT